MRYSKVMKTDGIHSFLVSIPDDVEDVDGYLNTVLVKPVLGWSTAYESAQEANRAKLTSPVIVGAESKHRGEAGRRCRICGAFMLNSEENRKCPLCGSHVSLKGVQALSYEEVEAKLNQIRSRDEYMFLKAIDMLQHIGFDEVTRMDAESTCSQINQLEDTSEEDKAYFCKMTSTTKEIAEIDPIEILEYIRQNVYYALAY